MQPSSIVFYLGVILYALLAILTRVGITDPLLRATAQTFTFAFLAIFTWLAMLIVAHGLDEKILMYWHFLRNQTKERFKQKKRKKK